MKTDGFSLAFGPSGNLYATGYDVERQHGLRDIEPDNRGLHQNRCLSGRIGRFVGLAVPEPSTFVLLGAGAIAFLGYRWRQRQAKQDLAG